MKIAFCGHSHHRVTQSTVFLRTLLQQAGEVTEYWDDSWLTGVAFDEEQGAVVLAHRRPPVVQDRGLPVPSDERPLRRTKRPRRASSAWST